MRSEETLVSAEAGLPIRKPLVTHAVLLAIMLAALLVRLLFYEGLYASDPVSYAEYAYRLATGQYEFELHHKSTRFMVFGPVAILFKLFGVSEWAASVWPLACSLLTIFLAFRIGTLLYDSETGLVASALLAVFPLDITSSMFLLPEPIVTAMMTASVYAFLRSERSKRREGERWWAIAAGLLIWAAFSAKILALLLLPVFVAYTVLTSRRWRLLLYACLGVALPLGGELLLYFAQTGDPLFRLHGISAAHDESVAVQAARGNVIYRLFKAYPSLTIVPSSHFGLMFPLFWVGVASGLRRFRRNLIPLLWFGAILGYLNFGTSSLKELVLLPVMARYLHTVAVPGSLLLAAAAVDGKRWLEARFSGDASKRGGWRTRSTAALWVSLAVLATSSVATVYLTAGRSFTALTAGELRDASRQIATSNETVYADPRSLKMLAFLLGYSNTARLKEYPLAWQNEDSLTYLGRFSEDGLLLVNWREVYQRGGYAKFSPEQRSLLGALVDSGCLILLDTYRREPSRLYLKLASMPLLRRMTIKQTRGELFGSQPRVGTDVYAISPRCMKPSKHRRSLRGSSES